MARGGECAAWRYSLLFATALVVVPAALAATTEKYWWGYDLGSQTSVYSSWNSWKTNKIWRPAGNEFASWFDVNGAQYYWQRNANNNPFVHRAPNLIYSRAVCKNNTSNLVTPVTCQVYDWDA